MQALEGNYDMVISFQRVHENTKELLNGEQASPRSNPMNQPSPFLLFSAPSLLDHIPMIDRELGMGWISPLTLQCAWEGSNTLTI